MKKFICFLMIVCMLVVTPAGDYLNANNISTVEAAGVLGGAAVLEVIMAGLGVTVVAGAKAGITDAFTSWVSDNGTDDVKSTWNNGLLGGTPSFRITSSLASSVAGFLGAKYFSNLNSGAVSSAEYRVDTNNLGTLTTEHKLVIDYIYEKENLLSYDRYAVFPYTKANCPGYCCYVRSNSNTNLLVCTLSDGSVESCFFVVRSDGSLNYVRVSSGYYLYNSSQFQSASVSSTGLSWIEGDLSKGQYRGNFPIYRLTLSTPSAMLPQNITILQTMSTSISAGGQTVKDALTSYGGYDNANITALDGLVINDNVASSIMSNVTTAVNNNKTDSDDDTVGVIWSDAIAQAVSDAYAKGLEDAKAEQDTLEEEIKKEESEAATKGFLSQILEAIKALPAAIFGFFAGVLSDLSDLITSIPSKVVDAWEGSWLKTGLESVGASLLDIWDSITSIPSKVVDAWEDSWLKTGLESVGASLLDIWDAITSIPATVAGAIANVWEGSWLQTGILSITDAISGVWENVQSITESLTKPATPDSFAISLSSLFPFCIPFDLYNMLSVLASDPVAPVFEWAFPNGKGGMEKLKIDLSKFDSVASLLRTAQVLLFSVGLALKTRDLIRG